ncbi:MAG: GntR family transcriptional regulator, partial [Phenylobacterium sp.]|nr:GntR family transcriptional regulator [Phenylobacterium sp.]
MTAAPSTTPKTTYAAGGGLGRDAPIPLYHQIYLRIRDEILSGRLPYGARAPTEQEVSDTYGVSRITSRRALDELAASHLVERKRRVGTRVIYQLATKPIEASIQTALDSLVNWGRNTRAEVLELGVEPAPLAAAELLGMAPGDPVTRALKVRWMDDQPLGIVETFMPPPHGKLLTRRALTSRPTLTILKDAGLRIDHARQTISATAANARLAELLRLEMMAPMLRIQRTHFGPDGRALLYTDAQYR